METVSWLLAQGGPSLRYRAMRDLAAGAPYDELENCRLALARDQDILRILGRVSGAAASSGQLSFNDIHGAANTCLENSLPMLLDRGVTRDFPAFDLAVRPLLPVLGRPIFPEDHCFHLFTQIILAPFLLWAGYRDAYLLDFFLERLDCVSAFCAQGRYDIHAPDGVYRGIPEPFRGRPVILPELYQNGRFLFPLIYDLYAYRAMYPLADEGARRKIDLVIDYALADCYQALPQGYGLLRQGPGHYYAMGWDCLLPSLEQGLSAAALHRMELLAPFPSAVDSPWFQQALRALEETRDEAGLYHLPKEALAEREGPWVLAAHMGLGENRRKKNALALEGTLRALALIKSLKREGHEGGTIWR